MDTPGFDEKQNHLRSSRSSDSFWVGPDIALPYAKKLTPEHRMIYLGIWLFYPCRPFYFPILVNDEVPSRMG